MQIVTDNESPAKMGLSGVLVEPKGQHPRAGVVLIGGSEGGMHERDAIALAGEGFSVLALAYFGAPGVPPVLQDIPLEYFSRGIDFLIARGADRIGILGGSRGGEAALLVASLDHRVAAAVSVVGSGVVTPGIDYSQGTLDRILGNPVVAWTANGEPVPALRYNVTDDVSAAIATNGTVKLRAQFSPLPTDETELDRISIPVEHSQAAILMIAAELDAMWDSVAYHGVAADRLTRAGYPHPWRNVVLAGAGHSIAGPPGQPITSTTSPGPGVTFDMGGDPVATTAARIEAWNMTVEFFRRYLL